MRPINPMQMTIDAVLRPSLICDEAFASLPQSDCIDPMEAPEGFRAEAPQNTGKNICLQCHWRAQCNAPATDLLAFGHRCMPHAVVASRDGKIYRRRDRSHVVFVRADA